MLEEETYGSIPEIHLPLYVCLISPCHNLFTVLLSEQGQEMQDGWESPTYHGAAPLAALPLRGREGAWGNAGLGVVGSTHTPQQCISHHLQGCASLDPWLQK